MLTGCVDTGCRLWPHLRKLCCPMLPHYVDRLCWHRMQLVATSKAGRGWWRIKAGAGIIKWGWRWRGGLTLPQCQPSIIIKIRPRTFISCIAAEKIHYNVIIIQIMCVSAYFLLQKHDWKSEFKSKYYVDHMPGERRHLWSLHKCYERIGNSCTSTRQYVWSSNESHAWLQIYLSTKAIVFFPILNNL